jgi:hypothetical protein
VLVCVGAAADGVLKCLVDLVVPGTDFPLAVALLGDSASCVFGVLIRLLLRGLAIMHGPAPSELRYVSEWALGLHSLWFGMQGTLFLSWLVYIRQRRGRCISCSVARSITWS